MIQKSLTRLAYELGVSVSYLSQVRSGKRPPSKWLAEALGKELLNSLKQNTGGSVWESNPPKTLLMPPNGVEVREAHRDLYAPNLQTVLSISYQLRERNQPPFVPG